jgi:hypothetical protein
MEESKALFALQTSHEYAKLFFRNSKTIWARVIKMFGNTEQDYELEKWETAVGFPGTGKTGPFSKVLRPTLQSIRLPVRGYRGFCPWSKAVIYPHVVNRKTCSFSIHVTA